MADGGVPGLEGWTIGWVLRRITSGVERLETTVATKMRQRGELLTADEVAGRLRVPRSWVYRAAREGDLPSVRCGRYRRFDEGDVERWITGQKGSADRSNGNGAGGVS